MITLRRANERGHNQIDWLESYHTFSFGHYHDERWMGFHTLRVINDDIVRGGGGFAPHPHRDMEILTWILEGALAHQDSAGNSSVIRPGDIQRMTAGRGIVHSEFNDSATEPVRLLQIWIFPERQGLEPGYEEKHFDNASLQGQLRLVASPGGRDGSVHIHQNAEVYAGRLPAGTSLTHNVRPGSRAWLQVANGSLTVNGQPLSTGDGAAITEEQVLLLEVTSDAEILLFDLG